MTNAIVFAVSITVIILVCCDIYKTATNVRRALREAREVDAQRAALKSILAKLNAMKKDQAND